MHNKRHPKNLITVRIVATIIVLLSLILPYFELILFSTTPLIILITLFAFYIADSRFVKKNISK